MEKQALAFAALGGLLIVAVITGLVLLRTKEDVDLETRKIRFASVTLTGILMLLVFATTLYFVDEPSSNRGEKIFDRILTALTPLVGALIGYLFGGARRAQTDQHPPSVSTSDLPPANR